MDHYGESGGSSITEPPPVSKPLVIKHAYIHMYTYDFNANDGNSVSEDVFATLYVYIFP